VSEPIVGDAFGEMLKAAHAGLRPVEVIERDDGFIGTTDPQRYFSEPDQWPSIERAGLDWVRGRVLDIGAGGGRVSLAVHARGHAVTALDVSPGAAEVLAARGLSAIVLADVFEHARGGERYDTFMLYGNNLGLLGRRETAPDFLGALAAMSRSGARIVAHGTDPQVGAGSEHLVYHERNRRLGALPGQLRLRVRYRWLASPWFDYLLIGPPDLRALVEETPWRVADLIDEGGPQYVVQMVL
jgi:SAM-dependent methyltransferase